MIGKRVNNKYINRENPKAYQEAKRGSIKEGINKMQQTNHKKNTKRKIKNVRTKPKKGQKK